MGRDEGTQAAGSLILTSRRVVFFRKSFFGEAFRSIQLDKITSVGTRSMMGFHTITMYMFNDEFRFKAVETKASFEAFYELLERLLDNSEFQEQVGNVPSSEMMDSDAAIYTEHSGDAGQPNLVADPGSAIAHVQRRKDKRTTFTRKLTLAILLLCFMFTCTVFVGKHEREQTQHQTKPTELAEPSNIERQGKPNSSQTTLTRNKITKAEVEQQLSSIQSWGLEMLESNIIVGDVDFELVKGARVTILISGYRCDTISEVTVISDQRLLIDCNSHRLKYRIRSYNGIPYAVPR